MKRAPRPDPLGRSSWLMLGGAGLLLAAALSQNGARARSDEPSQAPPTRILRLTESQYRNTIADIFGPDIKVVGRFEPDLRIDGLIAVGAGAISVTPAGLTQYEETARGIAAQVVDEAHRDQRVGCGPGADDPRGEACARAFFARTGLRIYRRPLTQAELQWLVSATLRGADALGGFPAGLGAALAGLLTSPDFLFRIDRPGKGGEMDAYSRASRLSYLLWNSTPDAELLAAAGDGSLESGEGLARQVDRMIASPRFVEGTRAFFDDYLRLEGMANLSKDVLIYPAFTSSMAAMTREQTLRTITYLLVEKKGDFRDLFTTRALAMHRNLGPIYDIPAPGPGWYVHAFGPDSPRQGLLTHASMLAQHSHPGRTSPTLRGLALREIFLCEKVPSPPANVNFAVVQDTNNPTLKTTRARLSAHLSDEECATCHKLTDPMGLSLEQFDGAGQFRTAEHDEPIDVSGEFEARAFEGAAALGAAFHDSARVSACFAQTAWRYAHGRNPAASEAGEMDGLARRFAAGKYQYVSLMRMLALDPSLYRMPPGAPVRARRAEQRRGGKGGES